MNESLKKITQSLGEDKAVLTKALMLGAFQLSLTEYCEEEGIDEKELAEKCVGVAYKFIELYTDEERMKEAIFEHSKLFSGLTLMLGLGEALKKLAKE